MARPLDGTALQTSSRRLAFGEKTQKLLDELRSSPPTRNPEGRRGNMPVWYPSKKMPFVIKAESHKVEFAFLLEAEHADDVLEYYDQPPRMQLEYRDPQNRVQRPLHTADYFVFRASSAGWEECKTTQELMRKVQEGSTRYQLDDQGNWRCPPGEAFAAQYGLTYRVRASDQINWAAQDNWLYIEDYYQDLERLVLPDAVLARLYQIVDENPGITLADLRSSTSDLPSDLINIALARHALSVNLMSDRLSEPRRARVFRDRRAALTTYHRGKNGEDLGIEAHPVELVQGQTVLWDGRSWRLNVGNTEIT